MQLPGLDKPFFGRDEERDRVCAALRSPGLRLLTLTGLGGIGKTALATNAAAALEADFPDGVYWIPLATVSDHSLVVTAINRTLGVPEGTAQPPAAALAEQLAGKRALLVLDNFEHVLEARALVAQIIAAADPGPAFLITSRQTLGIQGERRIEIGPMPVPEQAQSSADALRENESARLFEWRARIAGLAFNIESGNAEDVAAICRALDGIPLAIELAAARVHLLGTRGLLQHLHQARLGLLRSGTAEFAERHRAMSLVIAWSYRLLGDKQELFRRLCIFTGGFSIEAAESVGLVDDLSEIAPRSRDAGLTKRQALIDDLDELVRLNLVRSQPQPDGTVRYLILETIREFGLAQMTPEEETDANWALARYLLLFAERARSELSGADSGVWLDRLEAEIGNVRAALSWLLLQGPAAATTTLRLGNALWVFWKARGHLTEGRTWLQRIREHAADEDGAPAARIVLALGHLEFEDLGRSESLYAEAQEMFRRAGDAQGEAEAWGGLGMVHEQRGDYDRASSAHREALAIWKAIDNESGIALASYQLGYAAVRAGTYKDALTFLDDAREKWERRGELDGVIYVIMEMGRAYRLLGKLQEAGPLLTLSRDRFRQAGIKDAEGIVNTELGLLDLAEGHTAPALLLLQQALKSFLELDASHAYLLEALEGISAIASAQGDHRSALRLVLFVAYRRNRTGRTAPLSSRTLIDGVWRRAVKQLGSPMAAGIKMEADFMSLAEAATLALAIQGPTEQTAPTPERRSQPVSEAPYGKLTPREREVLTLIAQGGMTDQEVADSLSISYRTVTTHVSHILEKLGATTRTSAIAWAYRLGLCEPPSAA